MIKPLSVRGPSSGKSRCSFLFSSRKVLLLNDDYTPMEFVVDCITQFFNKSREQATKIMLQVHTEGVGVCGLYPQDIAETKMHQVQQAAKQAQHPLQCIIEPV